MNIVIIGAGAIGLLFYQGLMKSNKRKNLTFIKLLKHHTPLSSFSITNSHSFSSQITVDTSTIDDIKTADVVMICVKSYQVAEVLKNITPALNSKTILILTHNGMGTLAAFEHHKNPILALLTTHGCRRITRQHIIHTGVGFSDLGLIQGALNVSLQEQITQLLHHALPRVNWQNNIKEKQWLKLAINCVINPLTAHYRINNGKLCLPRYRDEIVAILKEFICIAKLEGINFELSELLSLVLMVAEKTKNNHSSMLSDIEKQQPTEIDFINGYLVNLAKNHQITLLNNKRLCQQIIALSSN